MACRTDLSVNYLLYNPHDLSKLNESTKTDWPTILGNENFVQNHLNVTLKPLKLRAFDCKYENRSVKLLNFISPYQRHQLTISNLEKYRCIEKERVHRLILSAIQDAENNRTEGERIFHTRRSKRIKVERVYCNGRMKIQRLSTQRYLFRSKYRFNVGISLRSLR